MPFNGLLRTCNIGPRVHARVLCAHLIMFPRCALVRRNEQHSIERCNANDCPQIQHDGEVAKEDGYKGHYVEQGDWQA